MKKIVLLFLSAGLMACAPQEPANTAGDATKTTTTTTETTASATTAAPSTSSDSAGDWEGNALTWNGAGQTFTFEDDGQTYTAVVTNQTIYEDNGKPIDAATFFGTDRTGQDIEVDGQLSGTTITASKLEIDD
ncbi:hypothetical protein GCM10017783_15170 [Deinococcus piscis]|uniref:DUF5666 domain-containing protein n=1 Tax=Deinococcus piscis TaxID=394230 RepID=A0ABQ3K4N1_9DEIO|nr:hypothetical protein [Deinococcus piscis]GHG03621.1 hypothetical protein GCM10017783_15170 [Deinococcus piscis]